MGPPKTLGIEIYHLLAGAHLIMVLPCLTFTFIPCDYGRVEQQRMLYYQSQEMEVEYKYFSSAKWVFIFYGHSGFVFKMTDPVTKGLNIILKRYLYYSRG